jgi:hypothetical protein
MLQVGNVGLTPTEQKSHFSLWCMAGAPLLAGTDIEHATPETLAILTAPEVLEVNQDLGVGGRLQGENMGSTITMGPTAQVFADNAAIAIPCDSKAAGQEWDLVDPVTGVVLSSTVTAAGQAPPLEKSVHIRQRSSGMLLEVPNCAHAIVPRGPGPHLDVVKAPATSEAGANCGGKNLLWQFHSNGTITTDVDGQCINAAYGGATLQSYSCKTQGTQKNGQWHQTATGQLQISEPANHCLGVGVPPPGPAPPGPAPPSTGGEFWVKPMSDGKRVAVLHLNLNDNNATDLTVSAAQMNLGYSSMAIRDLWERKDLGNFNETFTAKDVPVHGVVMLSVTKAE